MTELMERVGVSRRTLYTWMRKGYVPYIRVGRSVRFDWKLVSERLGARFKSNCQPPRRSSRSGVTVATAVPTRAGYPLGA